jgi:hypothetical protein
MKRLLRREKLMLAYFAGQIAARTSDVYLPVSLWALADGLPLASAAVARGHLERLLGMPAATFGSADNLARVIAIGWIIGPVLQMRMVTRIWELDQRLREKEKARALSSPFGSDDLHAAAQRLAKAEFDRSAA